MSTPSRHPIGRAACACTLVPVAGCSVGSAVGSAREAIGGSGGTAPETVLLAGAALLALAGLGLWWWLRRGSPRATSPRGGHPRPDPDLARSAGAVTGPVAIAGAPAAGLHPPPGRPAAADPMREQTPLDGVLRSVADRAPGDAIAQQVHRLLVGHPSRDELVAACVRVGDQLSRRHPGLAAEVTAALARNGVHQVHADGEQFAPSRHEVLTTVAAGSPGQHDRVAETVRPGYRDGDRVIRAPQVVLYRFEELSR